ncbi:MAG: LutB/LldF family L-lactate oxidation iron-sulfur protein, partial [Lentisphaeraceae bacterium]|nr:LutB/LldF family L-lactate oxidation iron-sulfur protein [Lentisphaeraceae bacterium]
CPYCRNTSRNSHMNHPKAAELFTSDKERAKWHDKSLWHVRQKRDNSASTVPEWEGLRDAASKIKAHMLSNLDNYLIEFEKNCLAKGIHIHWASSADKHNEIVGGILKEHKVKKIVKSKSMLTEECHLNPYLEKNGIEVIDTDLGERIVQLREETPSHIVMPAIHTKREEISELFHEKMGTEKGNHDPAYLTHQARLDLRQRFIKADAGITGVNFAIAETGSVVVCTNEGNADLGTSLPKLHIACMGIEKIIPKLSDLAVFTRLLARSATGQPITTYTSHFHTPKDGGEMHIVIVDNGRTEIMAQDEFRRSLSCIRCGACMNTCPVYRRSGGHSYGYVIPGPIGSILGPSRDSEEHKTLPFACTLCASCTNVCPVKIDLHDELLAFRKKIAAEKKLPLSKRVSMNIAGKVLSRPRLYKVMTKLSRVALKMPRFMIYNRFNDWGQERELPEVPPKTFKEIMKERQKGEK